MYFLCAATGETRWTFETGDAVKSSPAVDPLTGLVLVGSHDGHVYALDAEVPPQRAVGLRLLRRRRFHRVSVSPGATVRLEAFLRRRRRVLVSVRPPVPQAALRGVAGRTPALPPPSE